MDVNWGVISKLVKERYGRFNYRSLWRFSMLLPGAGDRWNCLLLMACALELPGLPEASLEPFFPLDFIMKMMVEVAFVLHIVNTMYICSFANIQQRSNENIHK
jgi:hypothetical protein